MSVNSASAMLRELADQFESEKAVVDEMLAVLKNIIHLISEDASDEEWLKNWERARAVIAKAEGDNELSNQS